MANANPIRTTDAGTYLQYVIPVLYKDSILYLTSETSIDNDLWQLDLIHALSVDGDPIDPNADPDITKKAIGLCEELDGVQLAVASTAGRIRNGDPNNEPPKVNYKLTFEADGNVLDAFEMETDHTNPITLYTKIKFKLQ